MIATTTNHYTVIYQGWGRGEGSDLVFQARDRADNRNVWIADIYTRDRDYMLEIEQVRIGMAAFNISSVVLHGAYISHYNTLLGTISLMEVYNSAT